MNDVRIVRLSVWLIASLTILLLRFGVFPLISRMRSKITIVSLTEKPIRVRKAATIGRSILNWSIWRKVLDPGDHRQPVADGDRAQGDQDVVDHGEDGREAVGERMEPPPEIGDDDQPARHGGDQGQVPGLAGDGAAEIRDPLEEQVAVVGQRVLELGELLLGDVGLEVGRGGPAGCRPPTRPALASAAAAAPA